MHGADHRNSPGDDKMQADGAPGIPGATDPPMFFRS
jgi:hypothetical protein